MVCYSVECFVSELLLQNIRSTFYKNTRNVRLSFHPYLTELCSIGEMQLLALNHLSKILICEV